MDLTVRISNSDEGYFSILKKQAVFKCSERFLIGIGSDGDAVTRMVFISTVNFPGPAPTGGTIRDTPSCYTKKTKGYQRRGIFDKCPNFTKSKAVYVSSQFTIYLYFYDMIKAVIIPDKINARILLEKPLIGITN